MTQPIIGRRVQFTRNVDRYPHALIQAGEAGTVVTATDETIGVRLDQHVPGLDEWNNEVLFTKDMETYDEFGEACTILEATR
jgi:hypothetical protein